MKKPFMFVCLVLFLSMAFVVGAVTVPTNQNVTLNGSLDMQAVTQTASVSRMGREVNRRSRDGLERGVFSHVIEQLFGHRRQRAA